MNKREACELLGVDMKGLASIVGIKYDSLRSLKDFAPIHLDLIEWEIDKRFIKSSLDKVDALDRLASARIGQIKMLRRGVNNIERAKDN